MLLVYQISLVLSFVGELDGSTVIGNGTLRVSVHPCCLLGSNLGTRLQGGMAQGAVGNLLDIHRGVKVYEGAIHTRLAIRYMLPQGKVRVLGRKSEKVE